MLIRAGIIGAGASGTLHADALRRLGVRIVGVAAVSHEVAVSDAARLGVPVAYESADTLIEDDRIDVAHVCTPNALHFPQAVAAIEAGKHVVVEKPLATTARDATELLRLAEREGVVHAVGYTYRHYPMVQALRELVTRGELGRVHAAHGIWLLDELLTIDAGHWMLDPAQMGPALTLADVGVHWWDLVEHVGGQQILEVLCDARTARSRSSSGEDTAAVALRLEHGAVASGLVSQAAAGHGNTVTLEVVGDHGCAAWDIRDPDRLTVRGSGGEQRILERGTAPLEALGVRSRLPFGQPEGHADALHDLLARVYAHARDGEPTLGRYPTFRDGARGLRVLEAVLSSAASGAWAAVSAPGQGWC